MSSKGSRHEAIKIALVDRWIRARPDNCWLAQETTFRLSEDTYLEPDIAIYPRASGVIGVSRSNVLLVVEIADLSLRYDIGRKAALYASFGIREPLGDRRGSSDDPGVPGAVGRWLSQRKRFRPG